MQLIGLRAGQLAPLLIFLSLLFIGYLHPEYSHVRDSMSELSASGSLYEDIFRLTGFYLPSALIILFSVALLSQRVERKTLNHFASGVLFLYGMSFFGAGYFPCDLGCVEEGGSEEQKLHDLFGFISMLLLAVSQLIYMPVFAAEKDQSVRRLAYFTFWMLALSVAGFLGIAFIDETYAIGGLMQRIMLFSTCAWLFGVATVFIHHVQHEGIQTT